LLALVLLLVADRLMLAAERRGWVYYRHRKPVSGSVSSAAFGSVSDVLQPSRQVVVEQQRDDQLRRTSYKAGEDL
jgi:hypothetical protein